MDLNSARIIIAQMQVCFKDLKVPFVSEDEMLNCEGFTDEIKFRSWMKKNENLAEILAFVFPSHNIVQLTMNYYENIEDFEESTIRDLYNLLNAINNSDPTSYWLLLQKDNKLEFKTAYHLSGSRLSEGQFKSVLKRFLEQGPRYYSYIRRLINNNEDPIKLFFEMQAE
jgi:predicted S18 family serine protease